MKLSTLSLIPQKAQIGQLVLFAPEAICFDVVHGSGSSEITHAIQMPFKLPSLLSFYRRIPCPALCQRSPLKMQLGDTNHSLVDADCGQGSGHEPAEGFICHLVRE